MINLYFNKKQLQNLIKLYYKEIEQSDVRIYFNIYSDFDYKDNKVKLKTDVYVSKNVTDNGVKFKYEDKLNHDDLIHIFDNMLGKKGYLVNDIKLEAGNTFFGDRICKGATIYCNKKRENIKTKKLDNNKPSK